MTTIYFNPLADNGRGEANARALAQTNPDARFVDITQVDMAAELGKGQDRVIVAGGDGTLHHLANALDGAVPQRPVYYYPAGSGNDFWNDVREQGREGMILLNPYLENLPVVEVNGRRWRFLNGIGFGIDGYCCEEGDRKRAASDKPVNYTAIAIQGLLFRFKPCDGTVTVDGKSQRFRKIWLAPTMLGRFYGGGMEVAPEQNRRNPAGTVSVVAMHGSGKLKTLLVFPSIFKGEHIRHREMVTVCTGREITVAFDRPTALQIDGETLPGVTSYTVRSGKHR